MQNYSVNTEIIIKIFMNLLKSLRHKQKSHTINYLKNLQKNFICFFNKNYMFFVTVVRLKLLDTSLRSV